MQTFAENITGYLLHRHLDMDYFLEGEKIINIFGVMGKKNEQPIYACWQQLLKYGCLTYDDVLLALRHKKMKEVFIAAVERYSKKDTKNARWLALARIVIIAQNPNFPNNMTFDTNYDPEKMVKVSPEVQESTKKRMKNEQAGVTKLLADGKFEEAIPIYDEAISQFDAEPETGGCFAYTVSRTFWSPLKKLFLEKAETYNKMKNCEKEEKQARENSAKYEEDFQIIKQLSTAATLDPRIIAATSKKNEANNLFAQNLFAEAIPIYVAALSELGLKNQDFKKQPNNNNNNEKQQGNNNNEDSASAASASASASATSTAKTTTVHTPTTGMNFTATSSATKFNPISVINETFSGVTADGDETHKEEALKIATLLYSNLAQTFLNLNKKSEAESAASFALLINPEHEKSLHRLEKSREKDIIAYRVEGPSSAQTFYPKKRRIHHIPNWREYSLPILDLLGVNCYRIRVGSEAPSGYPYPLKRDGVSGFGVVLTMKPSDGYSPWAFRENIGAVEVFRIDGKDITFEQVGGLWDLHFSAIANAWGDEDVDGDDPLEDYRRIYHEWLEDYREQQESPNFTLE